MTKAFVAIHCETGKEPQVIKKLAEIRGVKNAMGVLGLYDIIVEIEADDSMTLDKIITQHVRKVHHVLSTMTLIVV